jgi:DNA-binding NarL/FixJ family response regulator
MSANDKGRQSKKRGWSVMKVLIVDDSHLLRERLTAMISELPEIEIIGQAENAQNAINSIRILKPDVAILDIRMPGGNGFEVLENIKNDKSTPLIIVLTNYPYPQYKKKCLDSGASYFFDKSAEFQKVIEVLKRLIKESDG